MSALTAAGIRGADLQQTERGVSSVGLAWLLGLRRGWRLLDSCL
jgi:hypothetical protein